jgi:hypothetical protein
MKAYKKTLIDLLELRQNKKNATIKKNGKYYELLYSSNNCISCIKKITPITFYQVLKSGFIKNGILSENITKEDILNHDLTKNTPS